MSFDKKELGFNPINKKRSYKHFFIKKSSHKNPKVDLVPRTVTLVTITNVTLFIKGTIAAFIIGIKVFELLHMDLCGLICFRSLRGSSYIFVIRDDYSRYTSVIFLKDKIEALKEFCKIV